MLLQLSKCLDLLGLTAMEVASSRQMNPQKDGRAGAALVNGAICSLEDAKISILDLAFLRSDACQDTVSVWQGRFFRLADHLKRFRHSCETLRLDCPYSDSELTNSLSDLVRRTGLRNAYVQMIMMRGQPKFGSRDIRTCKNHFAAFCVPYVSILPDDGRGALDLVISNRPRISAASVPSEIKNYHWIDFELGLFEAYERGGNSVVLTDGAGHVTEGPGFNVFLVKGDTIATPRFNLLPGITRSSVIELAHELGIEIEIRDISCAELRMADDIFITSTAGGIMPIRSIDGVVLAAGRDTAIAKTLSDLYWKRRAEGWHGLAIDYSAAPIPAMA
jgi:branched-chain amino acid aminotransferase